MTQPLVLPVRMAVLKLGGTTVIVEVMVASIDDVVCLDRLRDVESVMELLPPTDADERLLVELLYPLVTTTNVPLFIIELVVNDKGISELLDVSEPILVALWFAAVPDEVEGFMADVLLRSTAG